MKRGLLALLAALPVAASPADDGLRFEPPPAGSYALPPVDRVQERTVVGSDGAPAPLLGLRGDQVALVAFVYRGCHDGAGCPAVLVAWKRLDALLAERPALAARVRLVTVSFDPARDGPAEMAALARQLAPRADWRFLTTRDEAQLRPLLADFGQDVLPLVAADGAPTGLLQHVTKAFLVDPRGDVRNVYSAGFLAARVLLADAETVLMEQDRAGLAAAP
jgi:cytochrome oxidase Cu insertion factor (SCO1/SenC/PrrC family)